MIKYGFNMLKNWLLFSLLSVCFLLISCQSVHNPAPVVDLKASKPASKYKKGSLKSTSYTVQKGETLYSIAWRSNVDIRTLASINNITSPFHIFPGQKIYLHKKTSNSSPQKAASKLNVYSNKKPIKRSKKIVASKKKQAYGENLSREKTNKQTSSPALEFTKKIRKWQWPTKGQIIDYFSTEQEGNKGISIAGKKGDNVSAAADGVVVYAGNALRGYGRLIIIKHNDDYLSAYAHNDKILVKEAQQVNVGQIIAKMGNTDSTRVMLRFEVRFKGKPMNPLKYLPKR